MKLKLADVIRQAVNEEDPSAAIQVADFCRFKMGLDYDGILEVVRRVKPDLQVRDWDALLCEGERDSELTQ